MNIDTYNNELQKIEGLKSSFFSILNGFKYAYLNAKLYPNDESYQTIYNSLIGNLRSNMNELKELDNQYNEKLQNITNELSGLEKNIEDQNKINTAIHKELSGLSALGNGDKILKYDSEEQYNYQYKSNIMIILGVIVLIITLYYLFKKMAITPLDI